MLVYLGNRKVNVYGACYCSVWRSDVLLGGSAARNHTSGTMDTKKPAAPTAPKIVVRRSSKRVVVTAELKERLRANAKRSTRSDFPELPEWRIVR